MRLPTVRQLQYFLAVAECLSFSKAAKSCHITQSTLSNGLSDLEILLGEKLFNRDTRTVTLTTFGQEFLVPAQAIMEQLKNLVFLSQSQKEPLTGFISLGIIPTIAPYLLPYILPRQQQTYPKLDLRLKEDMTYRQLESLEKGHVDAVLMALPYESSNTDHEILWSEPFFLARHTNKKQTKHLNTKQLVDLKDLRTMDILLLEDGHCLRDHIIASCKLMGARKTKNGSSENTLGATSLQTLIQMVQHGYGATLLPRMAVGSEFLPSNIELLPFKNPQPNRQIALVWKKNDPRAEEFKLLGRFIKDASKAVIKPLNS